MAQQENQFFIDSEFLSPQALAKKHRLETDPASRKSHLEYLSGMEVLHSEVMEKVLSQYFSVLTLRWPKYVETLSSSVSPSSRRMVPS